ncbi:MAG: UDP-N-acetylglucosamine 2-epimerase (non-hydrolyzing) [Flavobacteriaceae bacterium]|nr:UDP-N-acetylglucosamine 2-epimerase (non-hydrolyzing) [Flavobacteriaceae bacterium]
MHKIVTIVGARPQFIKAAVLSRIIASNQELEEVIVHTGQHFDDNMSAVFFEEMQIPKPKYNLGINEMTHGQMTGQMLVGIEGVLLKEKPDVVLVYGDTNSTLAGALAAKKLNVKLIHVEAGLRSFNRYMPEEINRIATDSIADLLFCPTQKAVDNLKMEGHPNHYSRVLLSGDIMKDATLLYTKMARERSHIITTLMLDNERFVLATVHRQENTDRLENLRSILKALDTINRDQKVIVPLHPRTRKIIDKHAISSSVTFIDPVGYFDMLQLLSHCQMVITDSGGLQKEAYFNKKPCVILRNDSEWVELITNGYAILAGSNEDKIMAAFEFFKENHPEFTVNLYGDNAGKKMYSEIIKLLE